MHLVGIVAHGTTTYTLDYAAGNRILAEATGDGSVHYLYGHDCLGELRDDDWLYYLNDATGYLRQGVDEQGKVTSGWLFDPDGVVLEGPVSHLICGGVYDWSTGLIHKDGGYFDPMLGIWLALMPLVVVQSWKGGKKKRRGVLWYSLVLFVVCAGGMLAGCIPPPGPGPTPCVEVPSPIPEPPTPTPIYPPPFGPVPTPELPPSDEGSPGFISPFGHGVSYHRGLNFYTHPDNDRGLDIVSGNDPYYNTMVRPICDAPDNDEDDISWSIAVWNEGYRCEKNRSWRPRLVSSCVINSRCVPGRGWPARYSSIRPQSLAIGGKWWWYRGQVLDGGLVASGEEGVYHLWEGIASAPPGQRFPIPTPVPPRLPHTPYQ